MSIDNPLLSESDQDSVEEQTSNESIIELERHFQTRLGHALTFVGLDPELESDYRVKVTQKLGGLIQGVCEVAYLNANGKRFKTRADVALFLQQETRKSREHYFLAAQELRERILLTQILQENRVNFNVDFTGGSFSLSNSRQNCFFGCGNVTILDWGTIVTSPEFHTHSQVFPLGFQCIRQEKDEFTDQMIDCFCEIDALYTKNDRKELFSALPFDTKKSVLSSETSYLVPLFRISVLWNKKGHVKVYEGRTPQVAWQAVMLEELKRVKSSSLELFRDQKESHLDSEFELRQATRELRREYFKAVRQEQSKGKIDAKRPRILVDCVENLFDLNILRLIEGMEGVYDCGRYVFIEARQDLSHRLFLNDCVEAVQKVKHLNYLCRKSVEALVDENKKRKIAEQERESVIIGQLSSLIQNTKLELVKRTKKERENSAALVEAIIREEQNSLNDRTLYLFHDALAKEESNHPFPLRKANNIFPEGDEFGKLLELQQFLKAMRALNTSVSFPSLEELVSAYKRQYSRTQLNGYLPLIPPSSSKKESFWSDLAVELVAALYLDFERIMNQDLVGFSRAENDLPVSRLNWKEVARVIVCSSLCKQMKLSDSEAISILKGSVVDQSDRKTQKLLRNRLLYSYSSRQELQETVVSTENGIYVRIPVPGGLCLKSICQKALEILKEFEHHPLWVLTTTIDQLIVMCDNFYDESMDLLGLKNQLLPIQSRLSSLVAISDHLPALIETLQALSSTISVPPIEIEIAPSSVPEDRARIDGTILPFDSIEPDPTKEDFEMDISLLEFMGRPYEMSQIDSSLDLLPITIQRCFTVMFCVAEHPLVDMIISSPDASKSRITVLHSRNSFLAIRKRLLSSVYNGNLSGFYFDCVVAFETLHTFFLEPSPQKSNIWKLNTIFERLFYEMVITCECPLPTSSSCQICRSYEAVDPNNSVVCERCDGCFHLECLEPPFELKSAPKSEWYCPFCIEQKGIASAHPLRFAKVRHPIIDTSTGEVVGIENSHGNLLFIINFGTSREIWPSMKVRQYCLDESPEFTGIFDGNDYDRVSASCKAYSGWGGTQLVIPAAINPLFSAVANQLNEDDELFRKKKKCMYLLVLQREYRMDEWFLLFDVFSELLYEAHSGLSLLPSLEQQETITTFLDNAILSVEKLNQANISSSSDAINSPNQSELEIAPDPAKFLQGREDFLLVQSIIESVSDNEQFSPLLEGVTCLSDGLQHILLKGFNLFGKSGDSLGNEWISGWELQARLSASIQEPSTCCLCGKLESTLCSPFATFLSLPEWIARFGYRIYHEGVISREILKSVSEVPIFEECFSNHSNTAHVTCIELLYLRRASMVISRKQADRTFLMEKLCKVGSSMITPIGIDRNCRLYWVVDQPFQIFISSSDSVNPLSERKKGCDWFVAKDGSDLIALYNWFSDNHYRELALKKTFQILFPEFICREASFQWPLMFQLPGKKESSEDDRLPEEIMLSLFSLKQTISINDLVYVRINRLMWLGMVIDLQRQGSKMFYKVEFLDWPQYTSWYCEDFVVLNHSCVLMENESVSARSVFKLLKARYYSTYVTTKPAELSSLKAGNFLNAEGSPFMNFGYSNCTDPSDSLSILKFAMLIIERSLPFSGLDESEDRWGNNFSLTWRECVSTAPDAVALMQCQIMLEYCLRPSCFKQNGLKYFSSLPNKIHALKNASLESLALRVWVLDCTINYEKLNSQNAKKVKKLEYSS